MCDNAIRFFKRINKLDNNNFDILAREICNIYPIGSYICSEIIKNGYEDFNATITTATGKYFAKIFNDNKNDNIALECIRKTDVARQTNIAIPKIYRNINNEAMSIIQLGSSRFRVALIEYIDGDNFYNLGIYPSEDELDILIDVAHKLTKVNYKPSFFYDEWAIPNFSNELYQKRKFLTAQQLSLIEPINTKFEKFDFDLLPKSFTHGDMTRTNIIKDKKGNLWLIDFSVSNYMARIIEIIIICAELALINDNEYDSIKRVRYCFETWCQKVNATDIEKKSFPLLFSVASAINIMNPQAEIQQGNDSIENIEQMQKGMWGLSFGFDMFREVVNT